MHPRSLPLVLLALPFAAAAQAQDGGVYQESGGLVVVEIESTPPAGDWAAETVCTGFTFQSYYRWDGPNHFNDPGNGIIGYRVNITVPGVYFVALRNRHDDPNPTEENDCWIRLDGGGWEKLFSNDVNNVGMWSFESKFDQNPLFPPASFVFTTGEHLIEFSGRSHNFKMDRFHLHLAGHPDGENENAPESVALLGDSYCGPAVPNSSGNPGVQNVWGSTFVDKKAVTLEAVDLPTFQAGYFLTSQTQGFVANPGGSQGNLCLGGSIGRYAGNVASTGVDGRLMLQIDIDDMPSDGSSILAGQTWNWQAWFRDVNPTQTSNFTDGRAVLFQ